MLGKLFKYEWKTASKLLLVIHGFVLIFAVFSRIFLELNGGMEKAFNRSETIISVVAFLLVFAICLCIASAALFTYIYLAYRFYKNVFTDQGYLTNTLPVTPTQIVVSKGGVAILWIVIDVFVLIIAACILFAKGSFFQEFGRVMAEFMGSLGEQRAYFWITLISVILTPFSMMIQVYFCVAVGNLFNGHKVLGAVGAYIGVYAVQQIIELVIMAVTGYRLFHMSIVVEAGESVAAINDKVNRMITPTLTASLIFTLVCMVLFWFGTRYIMTRKLNLQ